MGGYEDVLNSLNPAEKNGKKAAVIGGGPAGQRLGISSVSYNTIFIFAEVISGQIILNIATDIQFTLWSVESRTSVSGRSYEQSQYARY
jgi:putative selenate reductase